MAPGTTDAFIHPDPFEVASGWVYGLLPGTPLPHTTRTPRQALDDVLRPALLTGPCYVTFSGGRDSSAVLAAATDLARREGLPLPIPLTRIYPDLPDTDESSWQRLVIDHLGLTEWKQLVLRDGETELLGPSARAAVREHGVIWPPALQTHGVMFSRLGGGSLLTGEGGDQVLGERRGTPFALLKRRRRPHPKVVAAALLELLPGPVRRRTLAHHVRESVQSRWLRPAAMAVHAQRLARAEVQEPLRYDRATWFISRRRTWEVITHNQAAFAAQYGVRASNPLLDPRFLAALARAGGRWGYRGRTATMRALFSDVLPYEVLSRESKASFNAANTGSATREFARSWDGSGVDANLVDPERLRAVWLSDQPTMMTGTLLHSAWLASGAKA